jgi:phage host-nuclease inhibitor protein Gam
MATKTKKEVITNVTFEQAEKASATYVEKATKLENLEADMNKEINDVKSRYQERITTLQEELKEPVDTLHAYAEANKKSWSKKSFEFMHTVIGFQTGQPAVTPVKKGISWETILLLLKKVPAFKKQFVRTKEEVNKEAILAVKNPAILNKLTEDCFIKIDQKETFYVKAKKEEVAPA